MYEQINQRAAQEAVQIKMAAAAQYDMNDRLRGQMIGSTQMLRDKPLLDVECDKLGQSISELSASVSELLDRIAPVCQPGMECAKEAFGSQANVPEATPSELRGRLMSLRARVEDISRLISPVKFRIEI